MDYRERPRAEQCIVPPAADEPSRVSDMVDHPRLGAGTDMHQVFVHALARELVRAFEERDRVAFRQALRAMTEAAGGPRRAP